VWAYRWFICPKCQRSIVLPSKLLTRLPHDPLSLLPAFSLQGLERDKRILHREVQPWNNLLNTITIFLQYPLILFNKFNPRLEQMTSFAHNIFFKLRFRSENIFIFEGRNGARFGTWNVIPISVVRTGFFVSCNCFLINHVIKALLLRIT
jgi:hypothetical protein